MRFFSEILGNETFKERLGNAILKNEFPHAFIIEGPKGCGKHTLATELSAALNCRREHTQTFPCGCCESCRKIRNKNFLDLKYLSRKEGKATIGVEEIRGLKEDVYLSPTESAYKIYIVEEADAMTPQAQNALLRIFEEPPRGVVIFLLCDNVQRILSTIKSRAQFIRMQRLSDETVARALREDPALKSVISSEKDAFTAAVKLSQGSIGYAKEMLLEESGADLAHFRSAAKNLLSLLVPSNEKFSLYSAIFSLPQKRNEFSRASLMIIDGLRDLILSKYSEEHALLFYEDRDEVSAHAMRVGHARLMQFYNAFSNANERNAKNGNMTAILAELSAACVRI